MVILFESNRNPTADPMEYPREDTRRHRVAADTSALTVRAADIATVGEGPAEPSAAPGPTTTFRTRMSCGPRVHYAGR